MVASLELELLDYADRFLSDNPLLDHVNPLGTLGLMDKEVITLFKGFSKNNLFKLYHIFLIEQTKKPPAIR